MNAECQQTKRILLVDDDEQIRENLIPELERLPAEIIKASTGNEAIEILIQSNLDRKPVDLVILDMWIPFDKDGVIEVECGLKMLHGARNFQLLNPACSVIVFTAYDSYEDCIQCIRLGAYDYIPKFSVERNNTEHLLDECRLLLRQNYQEEPLDIWAAKNGAIATTKYNGKVIGLFRPEAARQASLAGDEIDGYVAVARDSREEIGMMMLRDKVLRWERPMVIEFKEN